MSGDMMPKEQHDFIKGIQDYMLIASNMDEHEAWDFGFRVWQFETWLYKYMTEDRGKADTPQTEERPAGCSKGWSTSCTSCERYFSCDYLSGRHTDCGWGEPNE